MSEIPAVTIVCSDDSHADSPLIIDVFRKVPDRDDPNLLVWVGDNSKYTEHHLATMDLPSTFTARIENLGGDPRKYRVYRLHCTKCPRGGRSVPARRARMFRSLDLVAGTPGALPMELRTFGAIVSKQ